jgi:pimeloyl-ACP methyl ester carboxylesterase
MTAATGLPPRRVISTDGTPIAVFASGTGPPLLLVHGGMSDHRRWQITPLLEPHRTVHAMDRRGRGRSGDGSTWSLELEVDDVLAVLADLASTSGSSVDLLGHSLGGLLALRAAARSTHLRRLVLYEASVNEAPAADDLLVRMRALLAAGRREDMLTLALRDVVLMPDEEIAGLRSLPTWPTRVAAAHTLPRELGTPLTWDEREGARVTARTLVIVGGDSPPLAQDAAGLITGALPDCTLAVIEGQRHVADQIVPETFARVVLDFLLA